MRSSMLAVPLVLVLPVGSAAAWPSLGTTAKPELALVHQKPWHRGGPPSTRRGNPGTHYGWQRRPYQQPAPSWADLPRVRDMFRFGD